MDGHSSFKIDVKITEERFLNSFSHCIDTILKTMIEYSLVIYQYLNLTLIYLLFNI